ncbi:MAG: 5-formyltetrahydrofolate cyclo-ligase [Spirochaetales bacterium]|nr:5-formyltetrahydrofolate cyclo-ligase [Spirochaetales bacterium]
MTTKESKHLLRKEMQNKLRTISDQAKEEASSVITTKVHSLDQYKRCSIIYGYIPLAGEPDLAPLYDLALKEGKAVAFPVCSPTMEMSYHRVGIDWREHLVRSSFGNYEVHSGLLAQPEKSECALILVPGLAFTPQGERLGRSMGFFDRFLAQRRSDCPAVGVCFSIQLLESLPTEGHDYLVDLVISEAF